MAGILPRGFDLDMLAVAHLSWHLYGQHFIKLNNYSTALASASPIAPVRPYPRNSNVLKPNKPRGPRDNT